MTLEEKKALYAELLEKHGPGDGAVVELKAEIEAADGPQPDPPATQFTEYGGKPSDEPDLSSLPKPSPPTKDPGL